MHLVILAFLLLLHTSSLSAAYDPVDKFFLICGAASDANFIGNSRTFVSDSTFLSSSFNSLTLSNPSANSSSLYSAARLSSNSFSYRFSLKAQVMYVLRLHFLPFSTDGHNLSAARFSVIAHQSYTLLSNYKAPASAEPIIKEYFIWVDSVQLDVTFQPSSGASAFVNAIEVFTAPNFLFKNQQTSIFPVEMVYRINVGGANVTPENDTMWRTWITDDHDHFLFNSLVSLENSTSPENVHYQKEDATVEIAPSYVYSTARTLNIPDTMRIATPGFNLNVTWSFPVKEGYNYLVRAHFCDFISQAFLSSIFFSLFIGNTQMEIHASDHTDLLSEPFYQENIAEGPIRMINISIGRSLKTMASEANAYLNGLEIFKISDSSKSLDGIPVPLNNGNSSKKSVLAAAVAGGVGGGLALVTLIISVLVFLRKRRTQKRKPLLQNEAWSPYGQTPQGNSISRSSKPSDGAVPTASPRVNLDLHIPLLDIRAGTKNFDNSLVVGSGGFGKVYKGILADGTTVAVKRAMPGSRQGFPEFQTEIQVLSNIRHRHLVSLIGYCDEQSEKILVYEYMAKGTLRNMLYGSDKDTTCLSWKQRLEICIGAARGLHYLHTGYAHTIIHRDIKSTNILLDDNYVAKVSDFGLSKVGPSVGETHVTTGVKGTFGYFDPEYFKTQKLTDKSDVYSFGVMLFEVLCARPVIDKTLSTEQLNLAEWALHWQRRGQLEKIIDQRLVGKINSNSLRKFGETAGKCIAEYGADRPAFADVLWNLEYALQLHLTELKREPHEDSGAVESQITVAAARQVDSDSVRVQDSQEDGRSRMGQDVEMARIDMSGSAVFSQLVTSEGR